MRKKTGPSTSESIPIPINEDVVVVLRWGDKEFRVGAGNVYEINVDRDYMYNAVNTALMEQLPVDETWTVRLRRPFRSGNT